ncbi:hypothetical protein FHS43_000859 [Streptosporangium becharense]|uniref:Uncharacterized protein n=1 Tax=Streptosporangium becharense TaxID=1816182 RepID=A0A7W9MGD5_9ACTN|nr:hypothetical protein [Streptosporangium becharense]MBB2909613.1 hypothetical protein [Streptosporangium becharense]MBB5819431.1 hypothetical protein [Streptosporangium becharense]
MSGEAGIGYARIGPWSVPWHRAWWLTGVLTAEAALAFAVRTPVDVDGTATGFVSLALALYFWVYGQWRRLFYPEIASSSAQHWLVMLFALILALVLAPLRAGPDGCGGPIGTLIPWFGDNPPGHCSSDLGERTAQLVLLGLLAVPLAVSTAINRAVDG